MQLRLSARTLETASRATVCYLEQALPANVQPKLIAGGTDCNYLTEFRNTRTSMIDMLFRVAKQAKDG